MSKQMLARLTAEHLALMDATERVRCQLEDISDLDGLSAVTDDLSRFSRTIESVDQHFAQEEESVFPKLLKANPDLSGEVGSLIEDHRAIRESLHNFQRELAADKVSTSGVLSRGQELLERLDTHFQREHKSFVAFNKK